MLKGSFQMRPRQKGFTLIELVVVIVILGILAAVAIPKYTDLAASARTASAQGLCGALASSAVLLYASNKVPTSGANIIAGTSYSATDFTAVTNALGATGCTFSVTPSGGAATACTLVPLSVCNAL